MNAAHKRVLDERTTCAYCRAGRLQVPDDEHESYLICDSCGAIQLTYMPMGYQEKFHRTSYTLNEEGELSTQIIGIFGGFGSAKSTASLQEFFIRCLENPKGISLITAPTLALLKKTTIKRLLDEVIPPPLLESFNKSDMEFRLTNDHIIYAIPSDDEGKLRSINAGLVH